MGSKLNILSLWIHNEDTWNNERSKEIIAQQIPALIEATRTISHSLYPVNLEKFGFILTIEALIANVNESLPIELLLNYTYQKRPLYFEVQIYRIIQEFLSNVIKHAKATEMLIHIRDSDTLLAIILSDNGVGFDTDLLKRVWALIILIVEYNPLLALANGKVKKDKGTRLIITLLKQ